MMWWGRLVGALIGIPAGPFGILFGFLIGLLVDQLLRERLSRRRIEHFLIGEQDAEKAVPPDRKALVVIALGIYVTTGDGPTRLSQVEMIQSFVRERRRGGKSSSIRRLIDESIRLSARLDVARLCDYYWGDSTAEERQELVELLARVARAGAYRLGYGTVSRLRRVSELLGVERESLDAHLKEAWMLDSASCAVLGVPRSAGPAEVKRAYRRLAAEFHPDTTGALSEEQRRKSGEAFLRVQRAYTRLMEQIDGKR